MLVIIASSEHSHCSFTLCSHIHCGFVLTAGVTAGTSVDVFTDCTTYLSAEEGAPPPLEQVKALLDNWDKVPVEQLLAVFEKGHFAGVEEMRTNPRLLARVAPMGVNDIGMACQFQYVPAPKLNIPITSFDGLEDNTIDRGASKTSYNI